MDISLIIPTKNRHNFIKRIVLFYVNSDFTGQILFADSSKNLILLKIQCLLVNLKEI